MRDRLTVFRDDKHRRGVESARRYRAAHPERVEGSFARWRKANPTTSAERRRADIAWCKKHPVRYLLRGARARAKRKGIPFNLCEADLLPAPKWCPILGLRLIYGVDGKSRHLYENGAAASLDRIKNARGYVKGNVIIISLRANLLKGQATLTELKRIAAFYSRIGG
jgi:hypothetical protein